MVVRQKLEEDEAFLILKSIEAFGPGAVVVALVGHNQAINTGELGIVAWFKAARDRGWRVSIGETTIDQWQDRPEDAELKSWVLDTQDRLDSGHLPHSLRFYRNRDIEQWANHVLCDKPAEASAIARSLQDPDTIWLTRDLDRAKAWVRNSRVGDETAGMIASGQARRLAAEGLFVDLKPEIAPWILAPSGDIRSSNMLETVQNQYQIQGLEVDYALVCWDGDLRRDEGVWKSFKIKGPSWQKDSALDFAKNGYRVLLTRARKGMILFVPRGDSTGEDLTRPPVTYRPHRGLPGCLRSPPTAVTTSSRCPATARVSSQTVASSSGFSSASSWSVGSTTTSSSGSLAVARCPQCGQGGRSTAMLLQSSVPHDRLARDRDCIDNVHRHRRTSMTTMPSSLAPGKRVIAPSSN